MADRVPDGGGRGRDRGYGLRAGRDVEVRAAWGGFAVGTAGHVSLHAAPRPPAQLPHQVGVVPAVAQSFQARPESAELRAPGPCHVLTGLGGVGKTQLAAAHAHRAWDAREVDVLVWVTAAGRPAIVASYAQAAAELCGADPGEPEQAAAAFLAWLRAKPHRWLVVLDDVADPADLKGLWPPDSPTGRTLVTTRRRDAALTGTGRRRIDVGPFTPDEASAYLAGVLAAHDRTEPAGELAALAEELGRLPLALSQAAAYLADQALSAAAYRALLADRTRTLAHALPAPDALPDDQRIPVAAAWSLSADLADRSEPRGLARPLLALAAMLDPNGIPAAVLTAPASRAFLARRGRRVRGRARRVSADQVHDTLRVLHRLSLADHTPEEPQRALHVHALVQRTTRDALAPRRFAACARAAADALAEAWPDVDRDTALTRSLRANAAALISLSEPSGCLYRRSGAHPVLFRYGMSLEDSLQAAEALGFYRALTEATTRHLGRDHWSTLAARHGVAEARGLAGDEAGAAAEHAELLKDRLRVFGRDDYSTLVTRLDVARWQGQSGDVEGSAAAFGTLLDDMLRVHGPDHQDTLATRNGLARSRGESGDAEGAVAAYTALLEDARRVLGADDPRTLTARHNLAGWRGRAGDAAGAVADYAELLDDKRRVLGPDHLDTLSTRNNLASWLGKSGDEAGAVAAFTELVDDTGRVLGPDHFRTLDARGSLAFWLGESGDVPGAVAAYEALAGDLARVLGPDHRDTLLARSNCAQWLGRSGDAPGAAAAYTELVDDTRRVLGPDHLDTLIVRSHRAHWRGVSGDASAAVAEYEVLVEDFVRVLGPDHRETLLTRGFHAFQLADRGDRAGAAAAFTAVLEDFVRVLGPDHPDTRLVRRIAAVAEG